MLGSKGGGHAPAVAFPGITPGFGVGVGVSEEEGMTKSVVEVGAVVGVAVGVGVVTLGTVVVGFAGGGADVTEESIMAARRSKRADLCIHFRDRNLGVEDV